VRLLSPKFLRHSKWRGFVSIGCCKKYLQHHKRRGLGSICWVPGQRSSGMWSREGRGTHRYTRFVSAGEAVDGHIPAAQQSEGVGEHRLGSWAQRKRHVVEGGPGDSQVHKVPLNWEGVGEAVVE
jgi:hypothetical protein